MSSIENIRAALDSMLGADMPCALSLSGQWGVGKTYFWDNYIKNKHNSDELVFDKYSYVSLFGIEDLGQLKSVIFERTVPIRKASETATIKSFWGHLNESIPDEIRSNKAKFSILSPLLKEVPIAKHFSQSLNTALYLTVKDTLICIDDIERKGKDLRIQDVLGLISELKEKRNCYVVLIHNKDQLKDQEEYDRFKEKVIDLDYQFERKPDDVFEVGFEGSRRFYDLYKEKVNILGIQNIRIVQKLLHFDKIVEELCSTYHRLVYEQIVITLPLLLAVHHRADNKDIPTWEYIKDRNPYGMFKEEEPGEEESKWEQVLNDYGWGYMDELDIQINDMIVKGFPDYDGLKEILSERDQLANEGILVQELKDSWLPFRSKLLDYDNEQINNLIEVHERNMAVVLSGDINHLVKLLRQLNRNDDADRLVKLFIEVREEWIRNNRISEMFYGQGDIDPALLGGIQNIQQAVEDERTLEEVLEKMAKNEGHGGKDEKYLDKTSEEQFYDFFRNAENRNMISIIQTMLRYSTMDENQALGRAGRRAKQALERLTAESPLVEAKLWSILSRYSNAAQES